MTDDEILAQADLAESVAEQLFIRRRRRMEDFRYDETQQKFWDTTSGSLLGDKSVDGAIPKEFWPTVEVKGKLKTYKPSLAINDVDTGLTVEGSTWWPGKPKFLENLLVNERGPIYLNGAVTYNQYIAPKFEAPPKDVTPDRWINHVKKLFPDEKEHEHFFDFAAHMLQRPDEKVNHGIVIAGEQGIGKDTALWPLREGVGVWNTAEIEPDAIDSPYNGYLKSVMLVINEVRPHNEDHRASSFYDQLKPLLASPPDMLPMTIKYANTIYVRNLCHTILTTNHPLQMYIPQEDRRLFVMTSPLPDPKENDVFPADYFEEIYKYLQDGGAKSVIDWLLKRPLYEFKAGAPPAMTSGKMAIITSAQQVRRTPINELYERIVDEEFEGKKPDILFTKDINDYIMNGPNFDNQEALLKLIRAKNFHFKMDELGYDLYKNPHANEWIAGKYRSRTAFVKKSLPQKDRYDVVMDELSRRPLVWSFK